LSDQYRLLSLTGRGQISDDLKAVIICQKMNWDYYTYQSQPNWFITALMDKMSIDADRENMEAKKAKNKSRYGR
jgi:hypothetical protein